MFASEDDKLRHKILRTFFDATKLIIVMGRGTQGISVDLQSLSTKLSTTIEKIEEVATVMFAEGDIVYSSNDQKTLALQSTEKSISSFLEEKYLKRRWNNFKTLSEYWLKWIVIFSTGVSLWTATTTCNKSKNNEQYIIQIQRQIDSLKDKALPLPQSKIQPFVSPLKDSLHK